MMIPTILAATVGALGTLAAPTTHADLSGLKASGIEVVLDVSDTHFEAENLGLHDYRFVFGNADQGVMSHMLVHPGTSVTFDFQAGLLDGMFIEILSVHDGRRIGSGALPLGELAEQEADSIWVQVASKRLDAWIERADGFDLWAAYGPLAPQSEEARATQATSQTHKSMHVPVVDPSDEPEEEKPPVLEPKPLPPV